MGNRYTWVRMLVTTVNRDRPGGHGNSYATDSLGYREPYGPKGCKHMKSQTRKMQRRQHARVTREAFTEHYAQADEDFMDSVMALDEIYDEDYAYDEDFFDNYPIEYNESDNFNYYDHYDD